MKTIGKYQVLDEMGRSASGARYRARDPFRNREYALKILSPVAALDAAAKDRLYSELAACAELSHRQIVRVQDVGEADGGVYLATDLLAGGDLRVLLAGQTANPANTAPTTMAQKLALVAQACEGLAYAHSKGIVHGNIKPSNIFITSARDAALLDFGIGKWQSLLLTAGARLSGLLANYFAPEQILGQRFDERSDVFSVGVVLSEALANKYPFQAQAGVIPREIVHAEVQPLRSIDPQIPEQLEQIVIRALVKDPQARLQTVDEFAATLYAIAQRLRREQPSPPENPISTSVETGQKKTSPEEKADAVTTELAGRPVPAWSARSYAANLDVAKKEASLPTPVAEAAPPPTTQPSVAAPAKAADPTTRPVAPRASREPARPLGRAVPAQSPRRPAAPAPRTKPGIASRRVVSFAVGAILAISFAGALISRQNLRASQNKRHEAEDSGRVAPQTPIPRRAIAKPVSPEPISEPAAKTPDEEERAPTQTLRVQVKPLWEAGRYTEAMQLVDAVLSDNPANTEARAWKKKIRAAQEAEAAMK
jgi:eukaryotic-like serine/threonine-protein kinase